MNVIFSRVVEFKVSSFDANKKKVVVLYAELTVKFKVAIKTLSACQ